jgi:hypothetical protein
MAERLVNVQETCRGFVEVFEPLPNKKLYRFSSAPEAVFGMLPNLTNRSFFYEKNV